MKIPKEQEEKRMEKIINFDMDGTIADLYGVANWLEYLQNDDAYPYGQARPLINLQALARRLNNLRRKGYKINIITWLAKNSNKEYEEQVTKTKMKWLRKHLKSVQFDNVYILPYGTPKHTISTGILFDDEEKNIKEWGKGGYYPEDIFKVLSTLN